MAKIENGVLTLDPAKNERFAVLITGGDANANGLADLTLEVVTDPPGPNVVPHIGPLTKDLPVDAVLATVHLGARAIGLPGVATAQADQVLAALRAASRLP